MVAGSEQAALLGRLDHHLGAVDVAGDDVDALVGEAVGRFRLLDRHRPIAGEDHLDGDGRVDRTRAEGEGVDVAQHLWDRLGGDEAELLGLGDMGGDDAGEIFRFVDVAEIAVDVVRQAFAPQTAAMKERDVRILFRFLENVRIEIAERGRKEQRRAVEVDHALHGLLDVDGLRDPLFLDDLDPHRLDRGGAGGVRLVVAVVVLRTDVDKADRQRACRPRRTERQGGKDGAGGHAGEDCAARDPKILGHAGAFPWLRDGDRMRQTASASCMQETNCVPADAK